MISSDKCTRSCIVLSPKLCIPKETNDINVKAFNMITSKSHAIVNANSIKQHVIQNKNRIIKHVNVNVKIVIRVKKIITRILAHVPVRIVSI